MCAKILVVDDNPLNLKLASATLSRAGHEIATAATGFEALETASNQSLLSGRAGCSR